MRWWAPDEVVEAEEAEGREEEEIGNAGGGQQSTQGQGIWGGRRHGDEGGEVSDRPGDKEVSHGGRTEALRWQAHERPCSGGRHSKTTVGRPCWRWLRRDNGVRRVRRAVNREAGVAAAAMHSASGSVKIFPVPDSRLVPTSDLRHDQLLSSSLLSLPSLSFLHLTPRHGHPVLSSSALLSITVGYLPARGGQPLRGSPWLALPVRRGAITRAVTQHMGSWSEADDEKDRYWETKGDLPGCLFAIAMPPQVVTLEALSSTVHSHHPSVTCAQASRRDARGS